MNVPRWSTAAAALAAALGCLPATPTAAQYGESTGNIHGRVVDGQGAALPGVSLTEMGPGAARTAVTDGRSEFHFLKLSPGRYALAAAREGFATTEQQNVTVALGETRS